MGVAKVHYKGQLRLMDLDMTKAPQLTIGYTYNDLCYGIR